MNDESEAEKPGSLGLYSSLITHHFGGVCMATLSPTPTPGTRRVSVFSLPNQLTLARFVLALVLFGLIAAAWWGWCLAVFALAAFTDWLDGHLARTQNLASTLGRNLDPLVDKVLMCGTYIFL